MTKGIPEEASQYTWIFTSILSSEMLLKIEQLLTRTKVVSIFATQNKALLHNAVKVRDSQALWHKAINRFFLYIEATYPYSIKNQRKAGNDPSRELWVTLAGSLWHNSAGVASLWQYFITVKLSTTKSKA